MYDNSCDHTYQLLDKLHISYKKLKDHTNDGISGIKTCESLGFSSSDVYKTVMLLSNKKRHPYIAVLPADRKIDVYQFGQSVGTPCHKANRNFVNKVCSESIGLFGPFFPENISVFLDASAKKRQTIVINAGGAGNYIELAVDDLILSSRCRIGSFAGELSVERFGKNYALPINSAIDRFRITDLRFNTPMEIFYTAWDTHSEKTVDICEFYPRYHGFYALRDAQGESVKWLKYTNDLQPRYEPDKYGEAKEQYNSFFGSVKSTKIISQLELNNTYYTVFEHVPGIPLSEMTAENDAMNWETIKSAMFPILETIEEKQKIMGCIRPDSVYIDTHNSKAYLLPFCAPTNLFGSGGGMRFMYNVNYDPFIVNDETAFYRVICCALLGKKWYAGWHKSDLFDMLGNLLSADDLLLILKGAKYL